MNIHINRAGVSSGSIASAHSLNEPLGRQFGAWGIVDALHAEDNTVDVLLDQGGYLHHVPVASQEWVIEGKAIKKDFNVAGERNLPPARARVFVFMMNDDDCFIAPFSGFYRRKGNEPFYTEDEGKEKIRERITPSGWYTTHDCVTGSHKIVSPDEKTSVEIDYGTEDEPKDGEIHINLLSEVKINQKPGELTISLFDDEVKIEHAQRDTYKMTAYGNVLVIKDGEVKLEAKNIIVNATEKMQIMGGGELEVAGVASTDTNGPFCAIKICPFSGAQHCGKTVSGI
jgi:hypothetical protein